MFYWSGLSRAQTFTVEVLESLLEHNQWRDITYYLIESIEAYHRRIDSGILHVINCTLMFGMRSLDIFKYVHIFVLDMYEW